ncbi:sugar ABC transporter ATP-binding protein [Nesterenkonia lutea]|uniref:ABC-type sugar transport system ATPase subunit n=1 Tax=Nesterenkonia lutea TaxID=272919 RepID=A0ABR9JBS4_9MICC|nr:sugar ABC transporter ATP-binding protein [Nesterenkonia lutea]MBE1523386.1 ABC-type sugar transport system ATPase subunit [Nesterenkonia lutea]
MATNATAGGTVMPPASADTATVILKVENLTKRFGPTVALRDASIEIRAGEIHALVGENGSGKSTLVKILSGVHTPNEGSITIDGKVHSRLPSPRASQAAGIFTVFQEVLSAPNRSVLENLWLGVDGVLRSRISHNEKVTRARAILQELLETPPSLDTLVEDLSLSDRQVCSIARAMLRNPRILILDEATSALDFDSRTRLFDVVRRLRSTGVGIILITHRMDEIEEIGDQITVLRSGATVGTVSGHAWTTKQLVEMMTGGEHLTQPTARAESRVRPVDAPVLLRTEELVLSPGKAPVSIAIRAGELIGLAGLEGQGQDTFLKALAGLHPAPGRVLRVHDDAETPITSHDQAHAQRIAYVPRERRGESLYEWMSILDNFVAPTIAKDAVRGFIRPERTSKRFAKYIDLLHIKLGRSSDAIATLSGGNQQKVIIARWLATEPRVLLLNDPTRGIDINAKRDLYRLLAQLTSEGLAVVMLSTEVDEHIELMDRVLVFSEHACSNELDRSSLTRESLVASFFGKEATDVSTH